MIFRYKASTTDGRTQEGQVDAQSRDLAVVALQRRGLIVLSVEEIGTRHWYNLALFERVQSKEIVIVFRQLSTLFEAKVPVLASFRLLATESSNPKLHRIMTNVADDIQAGFPISKAVEKHPDIFTNFHVNMILSGEETGKLSETFRYLADYLERQHELTSKAKHAMVYPSFIIFAFFAVMGLMFTFVIPKLTEIIKETNQEVPIYTKIVIATSDFFVHYGIFAVLGFILAALGLWRYSLTPSGKIWVERTRLAIPYVGDLYRKLYLSRIADNLDTMLTSGISMIKAIEVTGKIVGAHLYEAILEDAANTVRGGGSLSSALAKYEDIPSILTQMIKIGEETGKLGFVLGTIARFYKREVEAAIETLVSLIEPVMIIVLGVGVGIMLTSILLPIYNIAGSI